MNNKENNKILWIVGGVVAVLVLSLLINSNGRYGGIYSGMMSWNNKSTLNQRIGGISLIDKHFIEQMIPHHDGAIAMANLALQKSKRPEIRILAETIIKAQTSEINDMTGWYKNWFEKDVPKGNTAIRGGGMMSGSGMHMGGSEDMDALENALDFDEVFIEQMIPHHQLAIMMAQMLKFGTDRPEMLNLAKNIIDSQSKEIEQMRGLYDRWYK